MALVLTRHLRTFKHAGERLTIQVGGERIELAFVETLGARVKVQIEASQFVRVMRSELLEKEEAA